MKPSLKKMPPRARLLLAAAAVVIVGSLLFRVNLNALPLPGTLSKAEKEVVKLRRDVAALERNAQERKLRIGQLREPASLFWQKVGNPQAEIAGELDKAARRANVTLQNIGAPRDSKISDNLSGTEISIQFMGSMHEIGRFIAELEANRPRFFWLAFTLAPDNPREPRKVSLSGRIMLITLSPNAARLFETN
jgi:hypothetical protein